MATYYFVHYGTKPGTHLPGEKINLNLVEKMYPNIRTRYFEFAEIIPRENPSDLLTEPPTPAQAVVIKVEANETREPTYNREGYYQLIGVEVIPPEK